ncbi:hypothetical protein L4A40_28465 [Bacillus cereus]|uniref:hypothetical protein n=1 Tax=Bacillus cereus TaxID=1396 RepID=UPI001F0F4B5F|nr:hypothetical protein [Bacillus cereus]MCH5477007.1 hypothetical protein [Bacillus cereus]
MSNLTEAFVREKLDNFFENYVMGNKGHADVDKITINGTTIEFELRITHKEVLSKESIGNITVFSMTNYVKGKIDVMNPLPETLTYIIRSPVGDRMANLKDVIQQLAVLA